MLTKRKKAPGSDYHPGAGRRAYQSTPAGGFATRAGREGERRSKRGALSPLAFHHQSCSHRSATIDGVCNGHDGRNIFGVSRERPCDRCAAVRGHRAAWRYRPDRAFPRQGSRCDARGQSEPPAARSISRPNNALPHGTVLPGGSYKGTRGASGIVATASSPLFGPAAGALRAEPERDRRARMTAEAVFARHAKPGERSGRRPPETRPHSRNRSAMCSIVLSFHKREMSSFGHLSGRTKRLRQKMFTRDTCKLRHLREVLDRHGLPLTDRARAFPNARSKTTEATTFGFEVFDELVHARKLSSTEISVKLIYSAPLHRNAFGFGGVC